MEREKLIFQNNIATRYWIAAKYLERCVGINWEVQVRAAMFRVRTTVFPGDTSLLGCDIVLFGGHFPTFWSIVLPYPSGPNSRKKSFFPSKVKAVRSSRMADTAVLTARRHIPQDLFFRGKAVPVRAMKTCVGLELQLHSFLAWAVMGVPWASSRYPLCGSSGRQRSGGSLPPALNRATTPPIS